MQHNIKSLLGYKIGARDGEIGRVKDFYFEDTSWAIRYLVVETGNWFMEKKKLIAPQALLSPDWKNRIFPVDLSLDQVKDSPDIDTEKPVSLQQEIELYGHYAWQRYGGSGFYAGPSDPVMDQPLKIDERIVVPEHRLEGKKNDLHLQSTHLVSGYHIRATDGEIGHLSDFMMDDMDWEIEYLVIDTNNGIGGKKVLLKVEHVKEIRWEDSLVIVDINIESVKSLMLFNS
ncbi:PRC-barrel domain-containing protein [Pedobacter mucosus]|uniref:PRC-barrel domain containing protein n=1 Tax=Pedobacter mucosus TaxID=2895286 RepID=UPI001EE4B289|nr:PRC-barrel domain-containing protein [Pedobacter mucosus]UKT64732.1 PRC-barrel domain-containing protein [Pedobacter mucosus]